MHYIILDTEIKNSRSTVGIVNCGFGQTHIKRSINIGPIAGLGEAQ